MRNIFAHTVKIDILSEKPVRLLFSLLDQFEQLNNRLALQGLSIPNKAGFSQIRYHLDKEPDADAGFILAIFSVIGRPVNPSIHPY